MKKWEQFEIDCTNHLKETYKDKTFVHNGGSDSTTSDIKVDDDYYIEVKHTPAQCCQFVLFPEDNHFYYSSDNKKPLNQYSARIINFMNQNYEYYSNGNKSKAIVYNNCEFDFFGCVKEFYKIKNVKYFITNNFILVPIDKIQDVFDITAVYRVKKSGSKNPSKSMIDKLTQYISQNYNTNSINYDGKHFIIDSNDNLNKQVFMIDEYKYMFAEKDNKFILRQLSNTCNSNVIFSIKLKK